MLTTEFVSSQASLDQLENVIDPLNWAECLPFFCSMDPEPDRPDGWSRVLEHVSMTCPIPYTPQMVTPLKYWKGQGTNQPSTEPSAWVNYALDDDPAPGEIGDGLMVVDQGFIRMTSTVGNSAQDGVHVRTRKVAGFRNLAYFPAALFACVMGYGDVGMGMLLGGVTSRASNPAGWTNWAPSTYTGASGSASGASGSAQQGQSAECADPTSRAVALAVEMVNECIDDMSGKSAALAAKWATGTVPIAEMITLNAELRRGSRLTPCAFWSGCATRRKEVTDDINPKTRITRYAESRGVCQPCRASSCWTPTTEIKRDVRPCEVGEVSAVNWSTSH